MRCLLMTLLCVCMAAGANAPPAGAEYELTDPLQQ